LPKKIEFHLLLANLAFQIGDALASRRNILHPHRLGNGIRLGRANDFARPTSRSQRLGPPTAKMPAPLIQVTRR
jgi:hypothetical protein